MNWKAMTDHRKTIAEALAWPSDADLEELCVIATDALDEVKRLKKKIGGLCAYPLCDCEGSGCMVLDDPPPDVCSRADLENEHARAERLAAVVRALRIANDQQVTNAMAALHKDDI